jgi:hypothetical protein
VKVEDTVIITAADGERADGEGAEVEVEVLTVDPNWPTTEVRGVARPLALPFG